MRRAIIKLDFDRDDITKQDVVDYLQELIEDDSLDVTVVDGDDEFVKDL